MSEVPRRVIPWAGEDSTLAATSADADALRESVMLITELSDALVGQIRRARRLVSEQSSPSMLPTSLRSLERHAVTIRDAGAGLTEAIPAAPEALSAVDSAAVVDDAANGKDGNDTSDAARTVALDLRLQGHSREHVEQVIREFGIEDAESFVSDALRPLW